MASRNQIFVDKKCSECIERALNFAEYSARVCMMGTDILDDETGEMLLGVDASGFFDYLAFKIA